MKKIAQGRDRRRERQLEAAERQAAHTANMLKLRHDWPDTTRDKLQDRLAKEQARLAKLKAGNYPR